MNKKILLIVIPVILGLIIGVGLVFINRQPNTSPSFSPQETLSPTLTIVPPSIPSVAQPRSPDDQPRNANGYFTYMIDGTITNIDVTDPFTLDLKIDMYKIFSDKDIQPVVRTIVSTENTTYLQNNMTTNVDISINPTDLKIGDRIIVWLVEPNIDIPNLKTLTATKMVKYID